MGARSLTTVSISGTTTHSCEVWRFFDAAEEPWTNGKTASDDPKACLRDCGQAHQSGVIRLVGTLTGSDTIVDSYASRGAGTIPHDELINVQTE